MGCFATKEASKKLQNQPRNQMIMRKCTFVRQRTNAISDQYVLHEVLGEGAFAQVRRAVHIPTGNVRAVKIIHKKGIDQDQIDSKFKVKEVKILSELDHPNILRVFEFYEDRTRFYIVMEYCTGGELYTKLLKRKTFTESEVASVMFQLLSAVAYCHEKKVIHRDLKPENILLEDTQSELRIRVADFGSSAFIDVHQKLNGACGTPFYIAPEVLKQCYNEKCDVWSCGIIMYILLTGRPPYQGKNAPEILENVSNHRINLDFSKLSNEAKDLISKMLTINIRTRISAAQALTHPWIQKARTSTTSSSELVLQSVAQLRSFHNSAKLKDAIQTYIATQIMSQADTNHLNQAFRALDINGDGRLSREELMALYQDTLGRAEAEQAVDRIMTNVDTDGSGCIDFTEFLTASLNEQKYLSAQNLERAFRVFDEDGNGVITKEELQHGMDVDFCNESMWQALLDEADVNGDGEIDMKEFVAVVSNRV